MNAIKLMEIEETIKQAKQDIDELNQNVKEIKKEIEKMRLPQGRWKPRLGETYYYLDDCFVISTIWDNSKKDFDRWHIGNCFKTPKDIYFIGERLQVIAELQEFAEPEDREWDMNNMHYYLSYSYIEDKIVHGISQCHRANDIYFETEEDLYKAVKYVGADRIKKYYLRIED